MGIFAADTAQLAKAGRSISEYGSSYKSNITNIYSAINDLSRGWTGGASRQYVTSFVNYKEDLNKLGDSIVNMGNALQSAATSFDNNEEDLTNRASNL